VPSWLRELARLAGEEDVLTYGALPPLPYGNQGAQLRNCMPNARPRPHRCAWHCLHGGVAGFAASATLVIFGKSLALSLASR
jgi:hypothetical protein